MGSKAKALTFANKCEFYAKQLKAEGIDLYYHAHNLEFVKYDGHYMLDLMRDNTTRVVLSRIKSNI